MRIALFADIHGKILLPFKLVAFYQNITQKKIDLILQCGDIGAFPNLNNLDKATICHAQNDRDELGFYDDFTKEKAEIKTFLDALNLRMICVRGNHEDHEFLDNIEKNTGNEPEFDTIFPIDIYKKVWVCKSGKIQNFSINKENTTENITFVGIGRIGDRKGRKDAAFIQDYEREEIKKLLKTKKVPDLLISHDKDDTSQRGYGMAEIAAVLENLPFKYHFYGHTGEPFTQTIDTNGITNAIKIKELEFNYSGILPEGCMIILEINENENLEKIFKLEIVPQKITNNFTKYNWKTHIF